MNWLDILIVLVLAYSLFTGFARGFARMGIGLAAFVIGLICAFWFYGTAGSFLLEYVSAREIANLIGFFVVFFGVLLVGALAGRLIFHLLKVVHLSWLDRLLGVAFGAVRGVLIAGVIVIGISSFAPKSPPQSVVNSRLAPYMMDAAKVIVAAAPHDLKEGFERTYEKAKRTWSEKWRPDSGPAPKKPASEEM